MLISSISGIGSVGLSALNPTGSINKTNINFSDVLKNALNNVDQLQKTSQMDDILLATGQMDNLPKVMIDAEKANVALQLTLSVRDKIVNAYQEIMRMQI